MRIVVIGDDGVGKSTLITCLFRDRYIPNIEDVLPTLFFPRSNDSTIALVDTRPSLDKRKTMLSELRQANCIWLVYSDHYTMERISLFWLPFLRNNGVNLPVILCQNKQDRLFHADTGDSELVSMEEEDDVIQLMQDFKEIESFIRCSAKEKCNVNEAFYLCQRAICYPLAPLFDSKVGHLKPLARQALSRIFFLYDEDQSGLLTTEKLQKLQQTVFQSQLDDDELQLIHHTLLKNQEENVGKNDDGVSTEGEVELLAGDKGKISYERRSGPLLFDEEHQGITVDGFLTLAQLYCERGRHETIWAILRHFQYTDSLSLDDKFLRPALYVDPQSHAELSPDGYQFLVDLFTLFDMDNDGGLSPEEVNALFTPTPGLPQLWKDFDFPYSTLRNDDGYVTLQGWLAQWSMYVYLDHVDALAYIAMLGYTSRSDKPDVKSALRITKPAKRRNPRSRVYRNYTVKDRQVFNCIVLGASGCGKSTLLSSFLGSKTRAKRHNSVPQLNNQLSSYSTHSSHSTHSTHSNQHQQQQQHNQHSNSHPHPHIKQHSNQHQHHDQPQSASLQPSDAPHTVVNSVEMPGGKQSYLIMQEIDSIEDLLRLGKHRLDECDVVCLTYDSSDPDSFAHLVELRQNHREFDELPLVFAALKADQDRAQQRCGEQPDEYTAILGLAAPMHVSSNWPSSLSALFVQIVDAAMHPGSATIHFPNEEPDSKMVSEVLLGTVVASVAALTWWWALYRHRQN